MHNGHSFAFGRAFGKRQPELQPTEVTKVENILCCIYVFVKPDMQLMVVLLMRIYSSPPADAKLTVAAGKI